jgi:hypothetical protein
MNPPPGNRAITGEIATSEQQLRLLRRGLTIEYVSLAWMAVEAAESAKEMRAKPQKGILLPR